MATLAKVRAAKRAAKRAGEAGTRTEYIAFGLAGETYAVPIGQLAEILRLPPITGVPRAPRAVVGVVSVRGRLVTVIDLRVRIRLPPASMDRRSRILLVDNGMEHVGFLVDDVQQVWRLAPEEIEPSNVLGGDQAVHVTGIGRPVGSEGNVLILLDLRPLAESA
jgi:purine-binding chemotaxis protein CheW